MVQTPRSRLVQNPVLYTLPYRTGFSPGLLVRDSSNVSTPVLLLVESGTHHAFIISELRGLRRSKLRLSEGVKPSHSPPPHTYESLRFSSILRRKSVAGGVR
jgi:hypothetical protein